MHHTKVMGYALFSLLLSSCILSTFAYPQQHQLPSHYQQYAVQQHGASPNRFIPASPLDEERKFAEKTNNIKKVALDDIDDIESTNQLQDGNGFSWTSMLGTMIQMLFANGVGGGINQGPTKSDELEAGGGGFGQSPWANIISVGLKILSALLGGGAPSDGIDKVDNGATGPMQSVLAVIFSQLLGANNPEQANTMAKQADEFIGIVVNLLDALKTSFSHRSLTARSTGKKDSVSDAAVASLSMLKSYVRTYRTTEDKCMQKYLCEANSDCVSNIGGSSIFCQLGTYATSFLLERQTGSKFESMYDAGRKGRSGSDCRHLYLECNEV